MISSSQLREFVPDDGAYVGVARATFQAPDGEVSGPTTVRIRPDGQVEFAMDIKKYAIPPEYRDYLPAFLDGSIAEAGENGQTRFVDHGTQKITALDAEVSVGRFRGARAIICQKTLSLFPKGKASITLVANDLEFTAAANRPEDIWCVPLFGNLKPFQSAYTACSLSDKRPYIAFEDAGCWCGIEVLNQPTPQEPDDYSAVAFGVIGQRPHQTVADVRALLPDGLFTALSFAAGSDIRAPWIDLRSFQGHLSRRIHLRIGANGRRDGYPAFTEFDTSRLTSGLGAFLARFLVVPREELRQLLPPLNLIRTGTPGAASVDESLADLTKALDALCEIYGFETQNLMAQLDSQTATAAQRILDHATAEFSSLRERCRIEGKLDQLAVIDRIRDRQASAGSKDRHFGIAVTDLLEHFGLYDSEVMNSFYSQLPYSTTWEGLLSSVRGQVIHAGALHIDGTESLREWFNLTRHLHDLCKRLILKVIRYEGTYAASNVPGIGSFEVDRITPDASVQLLGYTHPPFLP
jgi:hypothetical protein